MFTSTLNARMSGSRFASALRTGVIPLPCVWPTSLILSLYYEVSFHVVLVSRNNKGLEFSKSVVLDLRMALTTGGSTQLRWLGVDRLRSSFILFSPLSSSLPSSFSFPPQGALVKRPHGAGHKRGIPYTYHHPLSLAGKPDSNGATWWESP
jgi:hypothetical protein